MHTILIASAQLYDTDLSVSPPTVDLLLRSWVRGICSIDIPISGQTDSRGLYIRHRSSISLANAQSLPRPLRSIDMSSSIECQQEFGTASRCLPVELLVVVAEFLTGDLCFGTVANLNATCNIVHQETLPVLFETTFWSYERDAELRLEGIVKDRGEYLPDYRKYVK